VQHDLALAVGLGASARSGHGEDPAVMDLRIIPENPHGTIE
jgi:hypothetical protein